MIFHRKKNSTTDQSQHSTDKFDVGTFEKKTLACSEQTRDIIAIIGCMFEASCFGPPGIVYLITIMHTL